MNRKGKLTAAVLCVSFALGTCSCSKKFEGNVTDAADSLGKAIIDRDYKKIEKLADEGDKKLENILPLSTDSSELDNKAREIIASTLTYTVDEDSFEGDTFGREGSIDIIFEYVDYESVTEDVFFEDIDDFEETIEDCDDTVEVTITFDFISDGGEAVCTNIGDITKLFPYASDEFDFALPRSNYAGDITFYGDDYDQAINTVYDTSTVMCDLAIEGDGQELSWSYYWVVECDGAVVYTSDDVVDAASSELLGAYYNGYYNGYETIPDGTYLFSYYTLDDELIASASVNVSHRDASAQTSSGPVSQPGSYFVCPADGVIEFQGTDLILTLPDDVTCIDSNDSRYESYIAGDSNEADLVYVATNTEDTCYSFTFYMGDIAYDLYDMSLILDIYESQDTALAGAERSQTDYTVGNNVFTVYTETVDDGSSDAIYYNFVLIGDSDTAYLLTVVSVGSNDIDDFMEGFSVA
jgi:hypothetical protein